MIIIPNDLKLPSSIIFLNLTSLFTTYCQEDCALFYKRNDDVITISTKSNAVIDIYVSDAEVRLFPLMNHETLFSSSKDFISTLVA